MSYIVISLSALLVSALTLFSGFGLGTLLMPAFALFFSLEVAVAATAVVHGANNVFKIFAVGRNADLSYVVKFGFPAIIAAFAGASVLAYVSGFEEIFSYSLGSKTAVITPIKLVMALLMLAFALLELLPVLRDLRFSPKFLVLGGILSGFFGGLSGHQGALRSAFLVKTGLNPQAFVGTNAVIGFLVDMARIAVYGVMFFLASSHGPILSDKWPLVVCGIGAAFTGVILGKQFLHKVTMKTIQMITGILLLLIALALGTGWI